MFRNVCIYIVLCYSFYAMNVVFANGDIVIQDDYWNGTECLDNGVPWQVPGSVYEEAEHCKKGDRVLELGTGGSTIFFARRCKHVTAIETCEPWYNRVKEQLAKMDITNVTLLYIPRQEDIEAFLTTFDTNNISIFSVDTVHGYNRSIFLNIFLSKGISKNLCMVVLDNYAAPELFPEHFNREVFPPSDWRSYAFDDPHWCGRGTKLYVRKIF